MSGSYQDARPKPDSVVNEPQWYQEPAGEALLVTQVPLNVEGTSTKTNEYPRAVTYSGVHPADFQFPVGTAVIWLGVERVVDRSPGVPNAVPGRRVLKPIYLLGEQRVIIDPKLLKRVDES